MIVATVLLTLLASCRAERVAPPCASVAEVRLIPMKGEGVDDVAYNALKARSAEAIPWLITLIADVNPAPDARKAPRREDVKVGDLAHFLLVDFTGLPFDAMFPAGLVERYRADGVDAYFEFVRTPANREVLRERWRLWFADVSRLKAPGAAECR